MTAPEPTEREYEIAQRTHGYVGCGVDCAGCNRVAYALARYRAEVVAAEREACARVADGQVGANFYTTDAACRFIAAAIRERV